MSIHRNKKSELKELILKIIIFNNLNKILLKTTIHKLKINNKIIKQIINLKTTYKSIKNNNHN